MFDRDGIGTQLATYAALGILLLCGFLILRPFIVSMVWAVILCYVTWPLYRRLCHALRPYCGLASLLMILFIGAIMVLPFLVVGATLTDNLSAIVAWMSHPSRDWRMPPGWLGRLPLLGDDLERLWLEMADDTGKLWELLRQGLVASRTWLLEGGVRLGIGIAQLSFSLFLLFFLYRDGTRFQELFLNGLRRLVGTHADEVLRAAGSALRAVVYGILGTAMFQGIAVAAGYAIAGVPSPIFWGVVTFFASPLPMGPPMVYVPAVLWLYSEGQTGWSIFLLLWGLVVVSSCDNLLRPLIISHEARLHFVLVFMGVLGGILAFGLIGVFIGPALLAIVYTLVMTWANPQHSAWRSRNDHGGSL